MTTDNRNVTVDKLIELVEKYTESNTKISITLENISKQLNKIPISNNFELIDKIQQEINELRRSNDRMMTIIGDIDQSEKEYNKLNNRIDIFLQSWEENNSLSNHITDVIKINEFIETLKRNKYKYFGFVAGIIIAIRAFMSWDKIITFLR